MTVRRIAIPGREYVVDGVGYTPYGTIRPDPDDAVVALLSTAVIASNARLVEPVEDQGRWSVVGDPTEGAILVAAKKAGIDPVTLDAHCRRLAEPPSDS